MGIHGGNKKKFRRHGRQKEAGREGVPSDSGFRVSHFHSEAFSTATANLLLNSDAACCTEPQCTLFPHEDLSFLPTLAALCSH